LGAAESLVKYGYLANPFEPFVKTQDRLRELFTTMILPVAKVPPKGATARQKWFWVLLPKQKDLACRDETRHYI
jgi:hypothetical protein